MEDKRVTAEQILPEIGIDVERMHRKLQMQSIMMPASKVCLGGSAQL